MMTDTGFFALGTAAGAIHFALLRWNTILYVQGRRIGLAAGLQLLRLAVLTGILAVVALQGALPLLLAACGVLIARPVVTRVLRMAP